MLGDAAALIRKLVDLCNSADELVSLQELVIAEQAKLLVGKCEACAYNGTCGKKGKRGSHAGCFSPMYGGNK